MNFEKNEFVFGIHEIFMILLKRIKLIICFMAFAIGFNASTVLNDKTTYRDNAIMYTSYSFVSNDPSNENYDAEINYYKLQIRNLINSLNNDKNYYDKVIERIEINKKNEQLSFIVPSYKTLKKSLVFDYNEGLSYFSFQIKYNCLNKDECYAVIKSSIEETITYACSIDEKLSVRYSTINAQYKIDSVIKEKPGFKISKVAIGIFAFGIVLAFALELFNRKVKYTYVVENIVHPNYMITMREFKNKGDK